MKVGCIYCKDVTARNISDFLTCTKFKNRLKGIIILKGSEKLTKVYIHNVKFFYKIYQKSDYGTHIRLCSFVSRNRGSEEKYYIKNLQIIEIRTLG